MLMTHDALEYGTSSERSSRRTSMLKSGACSPPDAETMDPLEFVRVPQQTEETENSR